MAAKDPHLIRPSNPQRPSMSSLSSQGVPTRASTSRHHSHSISLGSLNPSHRVTRRKSTNASSVNNVAAARAALNGMHDQEIANLHASSITHLDQTTPQDHNRFANEASPYTEGHLANPAFSMEPTGAGSAIAEGFLSLNHGSKVRARRASEGSHLSKNDGKRSSGELRCEKCGKGYKHSSCLTKHLWEHDPAWAVTSKLLISKHQQVQLLEAASVLVNMNQDGTPSDDLKRVGSDDSSASPAASGYSDIPASDDDDAAYSSAETTPPPMNDQYGIPEGINIGRAKRHSGMSSSYSRSYQSAPSESFPGLNGWSQYSSHNRPLSSGYASAINGEEESGLAAAVETLCSFGTPRMGPVLLPPDVPPVPPLPAQYVEQHQRTKSGQFPANLDLGLPSPSYQPLSSEREVRTGNERRPSTQRGYSDQSNLSPSHDDDEGVFGGMEGIAHESPRDLYQRKNILW